MEVDSSKQYAQPSGWQNEKRQREAAFYNNKPQQSFRQVNKQQWINHIDGNDDIQSMNENSMDNNCDSEATEEQPNVLQ